MIRTALGLLLLAACARSGDPAADRRAIELPVELLEVSGLAMASPTSVFAHNDERAVIHEIELADGRVLRSFALGDPAEADDFEGIAAGGDHIYLIASTGRLLVAEPGENGARQPFEEYDTGVGAACEIEGLSLAPEPGNLLIVCKTLPRGERQGRLVIYQWSIAARARIERPWLDIDLDEALGAQSDDFAPSGIEWVPADRRILVISARARRMIVLDEQGAVLATHRLAPARHPQAEGVTVIGNWLLIADEGERGRPARIAAYPFPLPDAAAQ
ncbi:MAG: SdiA-regulated domain-containing protein [Sphingomonadaceae bacterium]|nr:SdiA-regulated domain-containing protein [Sphingomonadaceae bacterium]